MNRLTSRTSLKSSVRVAIVGYRCAADIRSCLDSLTRSSHKDFEVHVCENGGAEAYRDLVHELSSLAGPTDLTGPTEPSMSPSAAGAIVQTRTGTLASGQKLAVHQASGNLGYAGGVNAIVDQIEGDPHWSALWILNPDTTVHPDALLNLVAYAANPDYGIVASRLMSADTGKVEVYAGRWRKWLGRGFNLGWGKPGAEVPDVTVLEREMDYVPGAAMFVARSYIEAVGRMDERYFLYNEEIDWCFRRGERRLGYAHESIVYHQHGATIGSSHDRQARSALSVYLDERNKLLFSRRFFPAEYPLILAITLILTAQYLVSGAFRNFGFALRGWSAGLLGKDGRPDWLLPSAPAAANRVEPSGPDLDSRIRAASGSRR